MQPRSPVQLTLALATGIIMAIFGAFKSIYSENVLLGVQKSAVEPRMMPGAAEFAADSSAQIAASDSGIGWIWLIILAAGLILAAFSIYLMRKRKSEQFIS